MPKRINHDDDDFDYRYENNNEAHHPTLSNNNNATPADITTTTTSSSFASPSCSSFGFVVSEKSPLLLLSSKTNDTEYYYDDGYIQTNSHRPREKRHQVKEEVEDDSRDSLTIVVGGTKNKKQVLFASLLLLVSSVVLTSALVVFGGVPLNSNKNRINKNSPFRATLIESSPLLSTTTTTSSSNIIMTTTKTTTKLPITKFDDPQFQWYCPPGSWDKNTSLGEGKKKKTENDKEDGWYKIESNTLELAPPAKKDFWRKTYYQPLLIKDDGPIYYTTLDRTSQLPATITVRFSLTAKSQFDQAGIMIRLDSEHWIKTGIEVVDGHPRLSCVVTNVYSDWSTQNWTTPGVKLRVHLLPQHGGSFVVEAQPLADEEEKEQEEENWTFVRIAHLNKNMISINEGEGDDEEEKELRAFEGPPAPPNTYMVGVFAASPVDQKGMVATFQDLSIEEGSTFVHDSS